MNHTDPPYDPPYEQGTGPSGDTPSGGSTDPHSSLQHEDSGNLNVNIQRPGIADTDAASAESGGGNDSGNPSGADAGVRSVDESRAVTESGGIAIEGGSLAGNKDDFEGDLGGGQHQEPGAGDRAKKGA